MLSKTKIVLSTLLVVGFASTALANEVPESKLGDRYPLIEQTYQQSAGASAFASAAAVRHPVKRSAAAGHTYLNGIRHHADPDSFIMAQLERDCSALGSY